MNFGRDIAQGLSKSFQQVGAQAPQQMQNERAQMQQAALNMMHQRQQEARFKEQQLLQQENQRRQQANIDRAFQAQQEQRGISNQLANDKFQFEQGKFKSSEQNLIPEQQQEQLILENKKKIKEGAGQFDFLFEPINAKLKGQNVPIEEVQKLFAKSLSYGQEKLSQFENKNSLQKTINNLGGQYPEKLRNAGIASNLLTRENFPVFLESDIFKDFLKKENYKTSTGQKEIKKILEEYSSRLPSVYTLESDPLAKKLGATGGVTNLSNISDVMRGVLSQEDVRKAILDKILKPVYSSPYEKNPISQQEIEKYFNELQAERLGQTQQSQQQTQQSQQLQNQNPQKETGVNLNQNGSNDIEGQIFDLIGEKRYPTDTNNQMQNPEEQTKQRNEILNKNVDQLLKNEINKNIAFTSHMLGVSLTPEQMKESSKQFSVAAEPIRKITQGIANLFDLDPEILKQAESVGAFEKENGLTSFLLQLPAQAFLMIGGEKLLGSIGELAKAGITENFVAKTALNAIANGEISKLSGENFTEGAIGSIGGDVLGLGLGKGLDVGMAARKGFKEGGIKDAIKAGFNELKPNIFKNQKAADIAEQQGKKVLEETTKSLNKDLEIEANKIGETKIKPIIENNINLKENLDAKTVKGFQEKGEEYYEKAAENYKKSKEFDRDFKQEEIGRFYEDVGEISEKLIEKNPGDKSILSDIQNVENMIESITSTKDAKNVIKNLNRDYSKSEKGFYQEIAKEYKPVIEKLITEADKGYYKLGNKYFTNLKQFGKQLKADNIVNDSFKLAEDLSELGSKDLQAIKSLNDLHSDSLSKLLKKPNLQNFDLTTAKGVEATLEKSLKELHPHLENPEKLKKSFENFEKDLEDLKYQLKKHPEIEKKFENVYSKVKEHISTLNEIEAAKQLNNKTIKEFSTAATEDIIKNPKKVVDKITGGDKSEIVKLVKDWIPKNWENVFESLSSPIETISKFFARNDVAKKLNEILNHHTKNEKFAKQLIAEDLAKDLENLIKQYKEKTIKSKIESTDKLKNLIGKISKTTILNLDRGDK